MGNKAFNYTSVPEEVKKLAKDLLKNMNYKLVLISKFSSHPADNYLWLVMGKGGYRDGYATFCMNTSGQMLGLHDGHYDMDFPQALADFARRLG